jgi:XTP/dITP diphosphohydrolase
MLTPDPRPLIPPATLIIGTANPGKARELLELLKPLGLNMLTLADVPQPLAIEEGADSAAENAELKAVQQARHLGQWVLGDDTCLEVEALGGGPGVLTARYAGPAASGQQNRQKLLAELVGLPLERRGARFVCHLVLADPQGVVRARTQGQCCGRIALEPRGEQGFGYDALFELREYHQTFAQLGNAAKSLLSHRARAILPLAAAIRPLIDDGQWISASECEV